MVTVDRRYRSPIRFEHVAQQPDPGSGEEIYVDAVRSARTIIRRRERRGGFVSAGWWKPAISRATDQIRRAGVAGRIPGGASPVIGNCDRLRGADHGRSDRRNRRRSGGRSCGRFTAASQWSRSRPDRGGRRTDRQVRVESHLPDHRRRRNSADRVRAQPNCPCGAGYCSSGGACDARRYRHHHCATTGSRVVGWEARPARRWTIYGSCPHRSVPCMSRT